MRLLRSAAIAVSMYSKIPMPQFEWKEEDMRWAIAFFPLVGVVSACGLYLWVLVSRWMALPTAAQAVAAMLIPVLVSGGIHVDGFMDTSDALSSWRPMEKRLEILKDSHIGAFAVIAVLVLAGAYLVGSLTVCDRMVESDGSQAARIALLWGLGFCLSRALSALSVTTFKNAKKEGTLYAFASPTHKTWTRLFILGEIVGIGLLMLAVNVMAALVLIAVSLLVFGYYRYRSYKAFGGITGDLAGWFLCLCETAQILALAFVLLF